jgi:hypothetical protein
MTKKRLGLIVGLTGFVVLGGVLLKDKLVSDRIEPTAMVEDARASPKPAAAVENWEQSLMPHRAEEVVVQHQAGPSSEKDRFLVLGERQQLKLELDKLQLKRVFDDGTTQYIYEDEMVVTILPNGEVLLLPEEI